LSDKYAIDIRGKEIDRIWIISFSLSLFLWETLNYSVFTEARIHATLCLARYPKIFAICASVCLQRDVSTFDTCVHCWFRTVYSSLLAVLAPRHMLWRLISARCARDVGSFPRSKNCSFILKYCFCFVKGRNLPSMRRARHPSNRFDNISPSPKSARYKTIVDALCTYGKLWHVQTKHHRE